jgi:hypothetical protein
MFVLAFLNYVTFLSGGQEYDAYDFHDDDDENIEVKPFKGSCQSTSIPLLNDHPLVQKP